jgi:AraC-like DNA-binding protein
MSTLKPPVTVSMAFVRGMVSGLQARGIACEPFLAEAGIDPELLNQASARVTGEQYVALFRLLVERLEDDGLAFFSRRLKVGSFALILRSALGAPDIEVAMRRIAWTLGKLQDDVELVLRREGALCGWELHFLGSEQRPAFMHELLLRIFWRAAVWLAGGKLPPGRFDLAFETPTYAGSYSNVLPGELRFGQSHSAVWFDARALTEPVRRDEAALRAFLSDVPFNIILPRRRDDSMSSRVRVHLQLSLPVWPDLANTAQALHMSVSALQRNLAGEGTTFQALKDESRRDMAISRLTTSDVPLAMLAAELGFSDSAAFQRAFKSWTGSPPGAYRQRGA